MWFVITNISFLATGCVTHTIIEMQIPEINVYGDSEFVEGVFNEARASLRHRLGLDPPIQIAYLRWMGLMKQEDGQYHGVFQGDLGHSIWEE